MNLSQKMRQQEPLVQAASPLLANPWVACKQDLAEASFLVNTLTAPRQIHRLG